MLNIPSYVIALFKTDGIRKNFRVHFPNNEMADITNDNIVQESVKFTESLCSQDVFKFGLTEASVIEFETVGIGNMYGMTIECAMEIDCSSLSAADQAAIAAGTWDGTWDGVNEVFAVPYGTFRVESCPRDHQSMAHRKVQAYSLTGGDVKNSGEPLKLAILGPGRVYTPDIWLLMMASCGEKNPNGMTDYGFTREQEAPSSSVSSYQTVALKDTGGVSHSISFSMSQTMNNVGYGKTSERIVSFAPGEDYDAIIDAACDALTAAGISYSQSGYASMRELVQTCCQLKGSHGWMYPGVTYTMTRGIGGTLYIDDFGGVAFPKGTNAFYAGLTAPENGAIYTNIGYPYRLIIQEGGTDIYRHTYTAATVYTYTPPAGSPSMVLTFRPTYQKWVSGSPGWIGYSFLDSYDLKNIINGFLELTAQFAASDRDGLYAVRRISSSSPTAIAPGEYSQMWWDEYAVEPIGTIRYAYTDKAGEEQIVDYVFGDGASIYDMTDNAVLKAMENATPNTIEAMLQASFVPYLASVNFTPIDLTMKGLPYLEAGDYLAVTAQDGTVAYSYALRQEISGIQFLEAHIDSQSGLIIDSGEGS